MENFVFRGQHPDEKTVCLIEKHWIVHVPEILYLIVLVCITAAFGYMYYRYPNLGSYLFCFIVWPVVLMYLLLATLVAFLNDRLDLLLVTNKRIVDITQVKFLSRDVSEASLTQIQDVKGRVKGVVSAVFGVGTIFVQTAGKMVNFEIDYVANPVDKARQILDISSKYRGKLLADEGNQEPLVPGS